MTLKEKIDKDIILAMKSGDILVRDCLRGVKTSIVNWQINESKDAQDSDVISIIKREIKQREESAQSYEAAKRNDLVEKETKEAQVLKSYLPAQLDEEAVDKTIEEVMAKFPPEIKEMGNIMTEIKEKIGQVADMSVVAQKVRSKLI